MNKPRLVGGLIAAEIFSMAGYAAFASLLVELSHRWRLDPVQAGWIGSAYLIGYALAVPALVGMTDRIDSRAIYLVGAALGVISGCGFAWLARGFWSAMLFRALAGMALAGTYMPGLRILTERLRGTARIRSVPYYTAAFGVGASLSFFLSGAMAQRYGWPGAFWASALGSVAAALLMLVAASDIPVEREPDAADNGRHPLDFRPVLTNRDALVYVLAYGGHSWELFGFRAWLPAYLLFAWTHFGGGAAGSCDHQLGDRHHGDEPAREHHGRRIRHPRLAQSADSILRDRERGRRSRDRPLRKFFLRADRADAVWLCLRHLGRFGSADRRRGGGGAAGRAGGDAGGLFAGGFCRRRNRAAGGGLRARRGRRSQNAGRVASRLRRDRDRFSAGCGRDFAVAISIVLRAAPNPALPPDAAQ